MPNRLNRSIFNHLETRIAIGRPFDSDGTPGSPVSALWSRIPGHLVLSAATLAIFGDYVAGGASHNRWIPTHGSQPRQHDPHRTLEPTEWVLTEIHMHALAGGFAQGTGVHVERVGNPARHGQSVHAARVWDPSVI